MSQPAINTLFSGGELFGTGARRAGWAHGWGVEYDPKIAAVARLNGFDVHTADVCDVNYETLPGARHLHASPSCRTASRANSNGGETAEDLAAAGAVCRAIRAHAAQGGLSFTLENVYGYRWYESYDRICATLKECGFIFHSSSKGGTKPSWRKSVPVWNDAGYFVNMADFGVPQTRERLILVAVRADWRPRAPGLRPTHGERGGLMLAKWRGWWSAVEDIAHEFPETQPAAWQMKRLPAELREGLLVQSKNANQQWGNGTRSVDDPAFSIVTDHKPSHQPIAYLLGGGNTNLDNPTSQARGPDEPAFTLRDGRNGSPERALLVSGQLQQYSTKMDMWDGDDPAPTMRTGFGDKQALRALLVHSTDQRSMPTRDGDDPAFTVLAGSFRNSHQPGGNPRALLLATNSNPDAEGGNSRWDGEPAQTTTGNAEGRARALLIDGDNADRATGVPTVRDGNEPAFAMRGGPTPAHRAVLSGRWVRITLRGLARFQTVPDDYRGLTSQINGNGVPCEFARQLMTILL